MAREIATWEHWSCLMISYRRLQKKDIVNLGNTQQSESKEMPSATLLSFQKKHAAIHTTRLSLY
jgi:hypothetical protein